MKTSKNFLKASPWKRAGVVVPDMIVPLKTIFKLTDGRIEACMAHMPTICIVNISYWDPLPEGI
jgi:hypothetical protein